MSGLEPDSVSRRNLTTALLAVILGSTPTHSSGYRRHLLAGSCTSRFERYHSAGRLVGASPRYARRNSALRRRKDLILRSEAVSSVARRYVRIFQRVSGAGGVRAPGCSDNA